MFADSHTLSQSGHASATWVDMIWCRALEDVDSGETRAAARQAVDLILVELVLCLTAQSAGFMYRCASHLMTYKYTGMNKHGLQRRHLQGARQFLVHILNVRGMFFTSWSVSSDCVLTRSCVLIKGTYDTFELIIL